MPTVATRCRAIAIIGTLTLGATGCAAGSNDGSGFGASRGRPAEGTRGRLRGRRATDGGPSNTSGRRRGAPGIERPRLDAEYAQYAAREKGALSEAPRTMAEQRPRGRRERGVRLIGDRGRFDPSGSACAGGKVGTPSASGSGSNTDGDVELTVSTQTHITSSRRLWPCPQGLTSQSGTLFLWPGLEPLTQSLSSDVGVLQPVLTWGGICAALGVLNN